MALRTSAGAIEKGLAGFRIANQQLVGRTLHGTVCRPDVGCRNAGVQKGYDIRHLIRAELYRRHSLIRTALANHSLDEIAILIVPDHGAANETRSVRSAVGIWPMAERARLRELSASALDSLRREPRWVGARPV